MKVLKNLFLRARSQIDRMSRQARIAAITLLVMVTAGAVWLAGSSGPAELVPVLDEPLGAAELSAARTLLESRNVTSRSESGKLLVPPEKLQEVRALLAYEGLLPRNLVGAFEKLARENDIWCSRAQNEKRWQAARMSVLSKLIGMFPSVRSATVLYEPGSPGRLGRPGISAAAAVNVAMKPGVEMTDKLIAAIADLVSGSIAGMCARDVRVIDDTGRSYRVSEKADGDGGQFERLRLAEAYYVTKIRDALAFIDNTAIGVNVSADGDSTRCLGASVCVPRSYFVAIHMADRPGAARIDDKAIAATAAPELEKIRQIVMTVIGAKDPADVKTDWYFDVSAATTAAPGRVDESSVDTRSSAAQVAGAVLIVAGLICAAAALFRRRTVKRAAARKSGESLDGAAPETPEDRRDDMSSEPSILTDEPFGFLRHADSEDLLNFVKAEHPQTIALILAHLGPAKAAAILGALGADVQADVARRIATLERIDPEVVREVERSLSERLAEAMARPDGHNGVNTLAEILHHAGYATEKSVLDAIGQDEPSLAESVRTRMFAFEDITHMPPERLREAMAALGSDELAIALRTASEKLTRKVLSSLPVPAAARVREEMERIGPVRLSDVEAAQQRVLEVVRESQDGRYVACEQNKDAESAAKE